MRYSIFNTNFNIKFLLLLIQLFSQDTLLRVAFPVFQTTNQLNLQIEF